MNVTSPEVAKPCYLEVCGQGTPLECRAWGRPGTEWQPQRCPPHLSLPWPQLGPLPCVSHHSQIDLSQRPSESWIMSGPCSWQWTLSSWVLELLHQPCTCIPCPAGTGSAPGYLVSSKHHAILPPVLSFAFSCPTHPRLLACSSSSDHRLWASKHCASHWPCALIEGGKQQMQVGTD